ncbi:Ribosomal protein S16 [Giardia muris]|uniref:Ribosomal protein S16 n=1 Tax=Giardia muris TaxID=5742 RepID=A0A4Z1T5V8_GIAMU|nr:Ribosomal protein S16 [Giardia muris]|eukprot:TNJ27851.1 Ribosomal protein S16 [Giardia muris]
MSKSSIVQGKKKNAVAVAEYAPGKGEIVVNNIPLANIRPEILRHKTGEPLLIVGDDLSKTLDIKIKVSGGGPVAQVYAIRQAIARAFLANMGDDASRQELRDKFVKYDRQLIVSDPRRCEAKKFGGRGARARRQKSYR